MRKMYSRNQIIELIQKAIIDGEVVIPSDLPDTTEATAGQILALDSDKEPVWADNVPNVEEAESGTAVNLLGLDENGDLVKETSHNKALYFHGLDIYNTSNNLKTSCNAHILNNSSETIDTIAKLHQWFIDTKVMSGAGNVTMGITGVAYVSSIEEYKSLYAIKFNGSYYVFYYIDTDGFHSFNESSLTSIFANVIDECNQVL